MRIGRKRQVTIPKRSAGHYGLELARRERELHEAKLARLREEIRLALDEVERGEILDVTVDAMFDELMDERRQSSAR
jgi:hypothetical protein